MNVVIRKEIGSLMVGPLEEVSTEASFIDENVCNVLRVLDSVLRVVDLGLAFTISSVEAELNLIKAVEESEVWLHGSFNRAHEL